MSREKPASITNSELSEAETQEEQERVRFRDAMDRLAPEYQTYLDKLEEEGKGMSEERRKKFLEFIADLNPRYLEFLNTMLGKKTAKGMEWEEMEKFAVEYQKRLEFFENNYALPLSDEEAIEALIFLQKDKKETAEAKVSAWRELAQSFGYTDKNHSEGDATAKPLVYLARAGFNIKEAAPQVQDEHSKKDKGLCYENWKYLQSWDFPDIPTQDEIRYFIPRLVPDSTNLNFEEQRSLIKELSLKIKKEHKECKNIDISMGEVGQIANQILTHYNQTEERTPLKRYYVRTLTRHSDGGRLHLGDFDEKGLRCYDWWAAGQYSSIGAFALGVETLGH